MNLEQRKSWIVGLALFVVTMILYWPATNFLFVNFDDQLYVYENPNVVHGLSWEGIKWAAMSAVAANWHPLTMLSHMADCSAYRLFAGGHHLTNILFHSANAVLLWLLLKRMTKLFWPSALVAALFAWHPLNVESVAWVAERKNVLSTFFFILTVWAYLRYVENPRPLRYTLALIPFALGLAAKPMLVTLPFILLLLDYWPLQRISFNQNRLDLTGRKNRLLLLGKTPFLILSIADCVITFAVQNQSGSVKSLTEVSMTARFVNIPIAYLTYLEKTFWPFKLCAFYAFPSQPPVMAGLISLMFLVAMTFMAWHWRFRFRWLLVGWLWFLGMLTPVIGLVQTGAQAMADRHVYLPMIGIFVIVACILNEWLIARPHFRAFMVAAVFAFLGLCLMLTRQQLMHWQNSVALFAQAVEVNPESAFAQDMLGKALDGSGQTDAAIEHYSAAVRIRPDDAELEYHLGRELIGAGRFNEAENPLTTALRQTPDNSVLHNTLGVALMQDGKLPEAEKEFSHAIELQPDYSKPRFNLGKTLLAEGQNELAATNFIAALQLEPDWPEALQNLARAYAATGNQSNAVSTASLALKMAQDRHDEALASQIADELKTYQTALNPRPSPSANPALK
jgi:Flp pilus assembly protein TadD